MALNLDKLKNKLASLSKKENSTSEFLWKPKPGKQVVRIVPYKYTPDFPFIELKFHYGLAGKTYLSPTTFDRPDPVAEFATKLITAGDKESWMEGKKLEPKTRTFVPVIVRGEEELGVRFWGFGKTVYQDFLKIMTDEDYEDICDLTNGRDVTVEMLTTKETGKNYPTTSIIVKPKTTPAVDPNNKELVKLIGEQVKITDIFKEATYDELKEALTKHLDPNSGNEDSESVGTDYNSSMSKSEDSDDTNNIVDNIDSSESSEDVFDELFENN